MKQPKFKGVVYGFSIDESYSLKGLVDDCGYSPPIPGQGAAKKYTAPMNENYIGFARVNRPHVDKLFIEVYADDFSDVSNILDGVYADFERIGIELFRD